MDTVKGTSRRRRQIPSSVPLMAGLWLPRITIRCVGAKIEEFLMQESRGQRVAARQILELGLIESAALAGFVHQRRTESRAVGRRHSEYRCAFAA
jgi:hypothetical protein